MSEEKSADGRGSQKSCEGKQDSVAEISRVGFIVISGPTQACPEATEADLSFLNILESRHSG